MSSTPTTASILTPPSLSDLRATLRRRYSIVLLGVSLGVLVGFAVSSLIATPPPSATVDIEVLPTGVDLSNPTSRGTNALDVDRALVRATSQRTLARAVEEFGSPLAPGDLIDAVRVRQLNDAPLLRLTVTHTDPDTAIEAAAAVAEAFLAESAAEAVADRAAREQRLTDELDELYAEIGRIGLARGEAVDPATQGALDGQRDAVLRSAGELERARIEVQGLNVDPGAVARPAALDPAPDLLGRTLAVPGVTALGLLVGFAVALLVDRTDRRVWTPEDVTRATGSTTVVTVPVPDLTGDGLLTGGGHRRLRTLVTPQHEAAPTVLVTGADPDHGAGVAAGLAAAVAGSGRRVVLLDAADRDAFAVAPGDLDGWLRGTVGLDRAARTPEGARGLQVLRGEPRTELVASTTLRELLANPRAVVILHVPGGAESGDAIALAAAVDRSVVVVARRRDRGDEVARTYRWLRRSATHDPVLVLAG